MLNGWHTGSHTGSQVNNYTLDVRPRAHQLTLVVRDPLVSALSLHPGHNWPDASVWGNPGSRGHESVAGAHCTHQWPASHTSPGHTMRGPDSNDHPSYEVTLPCLPPIHCVLEKTHLSCEKKGNITLMKYGSQNQWQLVSCKQPENIGNIKYQVQRHNT